MEAEVTFKIKPPIDCTKQQLKEWIEYNLQYRGDIALTNPLHEYDLDVFSNGGGWNSMNIDIK